MGRLIISSRPCWDVTSRIHDLIWRGESVDLARLADPGNALDDLTDQHAASSTT